MERYVRAQLHCHSSIEGPASIGAHCYEASRAGVYIMGTASSDAHSARVGWQGGNNMATAIRADGTDEAALLAGLRAGNVYMADPHRFRSQLAFKDDAGHRMGQVVALDADGSGTGSASSAAGHEVTFTVESAQPHWQVYWVVDGVRQEPIPAGEGTVNHRLTVDGGRTTFVRAEVWNPMLDATGTMPVEGPPPAPGTGPAGVVPAGRCLAITNPIIYHRGPPPDDVTPERRAM